MEVSGLVRCGDAVLVHFFSKEHVVFNFQVFNAHDHHTTMQHQIGVEQNPRLCCTFHEEFIFTEIMISDSVRNLEFYVSYYFI
jgi:hypothetical protein